MAIIKAGLLPSFFGSVARAGGLDCYIARMNDLAGKHIVLGLSGGIACYKAAELCRALVKDGATVQVVMTEAAEQFATAVTLQALSGRSHQVLTAVALASSTRVAVRVVSSQVSFRPLRAEEIAAYWASGEPQDKAGSYAIQGLAAVFVSQLQGSYSAVVGLPLCETAELLAEFAIPCWQSLPVHSQEVAGRG